MPRDYYEVLGVGRDAERDRDQEGLPRPRPRAAPRRQRPRPRGRGEVQGGGRGLRGPLRPRAAPHLRRLRPRGPALRRLRPASAGFGSIDDIFQAFFGGGGVRLRRRRRPGGRRRHRWSRSRSSSPRSPPGCAREVSFDAVGACEHCHGNGAEPGTPISTCERCGGAGQLRQVTRTPFGQMVRGVACDACGGAGKVPETPCEECGGSGRTRRQRTSAIEVPAGIEDGQRLRIAGAGHAGEPGAPAGDLYVEVAVAEDERFRARRHRPGQRRLDPRHRGDARHHGHRPDPRRRARRSRSRPGTQPGHEEVLRGAGPAAPRRPPPRQPAGDPQRRRPDQPQRGAARAGRAPRRDARGATTSARGTARASSAACAGPSVDPPRGPLRARAGGAGPRRADRAGARTGSRRSAGPATSSTRSTAARASCRSWASSRRRSATGWSRSARTEIPDDWADRWRDFHKPLLVGEPALAAAVLGAAARGRDRRRRRPRPGLRHRRPPDHPPLPRAPAASWRRRARPAGR